MTNKTAVIFGVTGQDGSYLTELLFKEDYHVIGVKRRSSVDNTERIGEDIKDHGNFTMVEGDITDAASVSLIIQEFLSTPDVAECYNLAAQSHVGTSFKQPVATFNVNTVGVLNILEAIRVVNSDIRFYQASTSEMFGDSVNEYGYQNEETRFAPRSPYAVAKMAAHNLVHTYRESYGIYASCGILFNHESERRGENFVTRKITKWIGDFINWENMVAARNASDSPRFSIGEERICIPTKRMYIDQKATPCFPKLRLGNLDAYRDWGHAEDYVRAMWLMLQQDVADDYVVATGEAYSVRDFLAEAFKCVGISDWEPFVYIDPEFFRPAEVEFLKGSYSKAFRHLDWRPEISFTELVKRMVESDLKNGLQKESSLEAQSY